MTRQTERSIRKLKDKEVPEFQAYLRSLVRNFVPLGCSHHTLGLREGPTRPPRRYCARFLPDSCTCPQWTLQALLVRVGEDVLRVLLEALPNDGSVRPLPSFSLSSDVAKPLSFQAFCNIRHREHIGLLSGTAFESPVWIEFEICRRRLLELALELERAKPYKQVSCHAFFI